MTDKNTQKEEEIDSSSKEQNDLANVQVSLQRQHMEFEALKALSSELTSIMDLGRAAAAVSKYLWELLSYSASLYMVYDPSSQAFELGAYLKTPVSHTFLNSLRSELITYVSEKAEPGVRGAAQAAKDSRMRYFGVEHDDEKGAHEVGSFVLFPFSDGEQILGALCVASTEKNALQATEEIDLIDAMVSTASLSLQRLSLMLKSQQGRMDSLMQSLSNGVIMFNNENKIILSNPQAEKFTGLPKDGYHLRELVDLFKDVELAVAIDEAVSLDRTVHLPEVPLAMFFYEMYIVPTKDHGNEIVGGAIILHDITHHKEIAKLKDDFLSIASHELRTPLTAIRGNVDMVMKGEAGKFDEGVGEYLTDVQSASNRLIKLVNDMLDVSRIEAGRMKFVMGEVVLKPIVETIFKEMEHVAYASNIEMVYSESDDLPKLSADPDKISQVLHNLIGNALKFTEKGTVDVSVQLRGEYVLVDIKDSGAGISKEDQKRLFSKFTQLNDRLKQETKGTGLGLYIVAMIVKKLGGDVWVRSEGLGKGSTFGFSVPVVGSKASAKALAEIEEDALQNPDQK